jgi:hypothetical protein
MHIPKRGTYISDEPKLRGVVDREEAKKVMLGLFSQEPNLFTEVDNLFWREDAAYEASGVFNYLFVLADAPTLDTVHPVVGFRLRNADERNAALATLNRKIN